MGSLSIGMIGNAAWPWFLDSVIRLFKYLRSYSGRLTFAISSSVSNKILDLMPPLLVGWVIDSLQGNPPDWIPPGDPFERASFLAILAVLIFFFESLFQWMYQYGFLTLAQNLQHSLRIDAYNRLQRREIAFFENHRVGETMAILNDDVNQLERFLNNGFNELIQLGTLFVFAGSVLLSISWELALVGLAPLPIIIAGSLIYQRLISPRYKRIREAVARLSSRLENNLSGILVIKSFTAEDFESTRLRGVSDEYRKANFHAIKLSALYVPVIRMAVAVGFGGVLLLGSYWILDGSGTLTVGELVLFSMMVQRLLWPLTQMGRTFDEYERASVSAQRVFGLVDSRAGIENPNQPVEVEKAAGTIALRNVQFKYDRGTPVLKGLSFSVSPGETIGIAGPTGSGKSTLIKLLLRLYDPTGGSVTLDGHDLRSWDIRTLRRNIALVSQDVYLFHGSILENILYGSASYQDLEENKEQYLKKVHAASSMASFHDFVETLPDGYDTIVGERGIKLSGGQRQRLSIARAIVKDAPILILDEATSSVDTETERAIQSNLDRLTRGRTSLIIAHRLSTIRGAHRILLIKDGQLTEEGSHEELVAMKGDYADLWSIQAGEALR
ncbi:MAG: ABC transporter ATP-binding protein [Leptospiraceae bacterium]|nr:ABC transporter ATP-binding protein [Leptospiraceae bacterium]